MKFSTLGYIHGLPLFKLGDLLSEALFVHLPLVGVVKDLYGYVVNDREVSEVIHC